MSDTVFLTGGSGFVGAHVLRELLLSGYRVRALSRSASLHQFRDGDNGPHGDSLQVVQGDLTDVGGFSRAIEGCRYVVHCAAVYSFAPRDRALIQRVNVIGTASLIEAARVAGVERFVLTSSSATLGPCENGELRTEEHWAREGRSAGYHHSKLDQERAAFAGRVPVIALLPTAPVGPGDWKPTPTGQMIVEFARGKMFARPPGRGGLNLVAVEDVARAHVRALTSGRTGERYILGGLNVSLDELWQMLSDVTGKPVPGWRVPIEAALAIAYIDQARCRLNASARPRVPVEGVRMAQERMFVDASKAQTELGFVATPVADALARAVGWYRDNGYV